MKWGIGDKLRILDASQIYCGENVTTGKIYDVKWLHCDGTPIIQTEVGKALCFYSFEMRYVERELTIEDYAKIALIGSRGGYEMAELEHGGEDK